MPRQVKAIWNGPTTSRRCGSLLHIWNQRSQPGCKPNRASKCSHVAMTPVAARTKLPMDWTPPPKHCHAAEDTPSGASPEDVETVPVFDRVGLAPKI